jgi:hypothetical protein
VPLPSRLGKVPSLLRTSFRTRIRIFFQKLNLADVNLSGRDSDVAGYAMWTNQVMTRVIFLPRRMPHTPLIGGRPMSD